MFQVLNLQIQTYEPHADVSEFLFLFLLRDLPSVSRLHGLQPTYNRPEDTAGYDVEICLPISAYHDSLSQWLSDL
jgi:hypothetical protein